MFPHRLTRTGAQTILEERPANARPRLAELLRTAEKFEIIESDRDVAESVVVAKRISAKLEGGDDEDGDDGFEGKRVSDGEPAQAAAPKEPSGVQRCMHKCRCIKAGI